MPRLLARHLVAAVLTVLGISVLGSGWPVTTSAGHVSAAGHVPCNNRTDDCPRHHPR